MAKQKNSHGPLQDCLGGVASQGVMIHRVELGCLEFLDSRLKRLVGAERIPGIIAPEVLRKEDAMEFNARIEKSKVIVIGIDNAYHPPCNKWGAEIDLCTKSFEGGHLLQKTTKEEIAFVVEEFATRHWWRYNPAVREFHKKFLNPRSPGVVIREVYLKPVDTAFYGQNGGYFLDAYVGEILVVRRQIKTGSEIKFQVRWGEPVLTNFEKKIIEHEYLLYDH